MFVRLRVIALAFSFFLFLKPKNVTNGLVSFYFAVDVAHDLSASNRVGSSRFVSNALTCMGESTGQDSMC